jgi:hypothetical protein
MMVKDLSGVEMKLAGEQHTHNQGMHPETEPEFSPASHCTNFALPWIGNACPTPLSINDTKKAGTSAAPNTPFASGTDRDAPARRRVVQESFRILPGGFAPPCGSVNHHYLPRCRIVAEDPPNPPSLMI